MENERIKEVLIEFLDLMRNDSTNSYTRGIINDLKNKLNQPEEPQGYKGLNKWYKTTTDNTYYAHKERSEYCIDCYGFVYRSGEWRNVEFVKKECIVGLATPSEIQQAILKGCEQNGIVKGAKVKGIDQPLNLKIDNMGLKEEIGRLNSYFITTHGGWLLRVFDNGKFAEVVKEEKKPLNQINDEEFFEQALKYNEFNAKPSDKELLKECEVLLCEIESEDSCSPSTDYKIRELLTKLNKHLNHE